LPAQRGLFFAFFSGIASVMRKKNPASGREKIKIRYREKSLTRVAYRLALLRIFLTS
jgi:hypothetical protein